MQNKILIELHKQPQTVFTLTEISLLFPGISYTNIKDRMSYLTRRGAIARLRKGVYVKENYNSQELANKLYTPSYISLETVLQQAGVIFQYYEQITSVSYLSRTVQVSGHILDYKKIKEEVLTNRAGIVTKNNVNIATPERAFLDAIYLYSNYHVDNLSSLNWKKINEFMGLYVNKSLNRRVADYYQIYQENNA